MPVGGQGPSGDGSPPPPGRWAGTGHGGIAGPYQGGTTTEAKRESGVLRTTDEATGASTTHTHWWFGSAHRPVGGWWSLDLPRVGERGGLWVCGCSRGADAPCRALQLLARPRPAPPSSPGAGADHLHLHLAPRLPGPGETPVALCPRGSTRLTASCAVCAHTQHRHQAGGQPAPPWPCVFGERQVRLFPALCAPTTHLHAYQLPPPTQFPRPRGAAEAAAWASLHQRLQGSWHWLCGTGRGWWCGACVGLEAGERGMAMGSPPRSQVGGLRRRVEAQRQPGDGAAGVGRWACLARTTP